MNNGTPSYMSPEVLQNQSYNEKADIWALGCILYEMIAGRRAFQYENERRLIPSLPTSTDSNLVQIYNLCMQTKPEDRPSIKELLSLQIV